MLDEKRCSVCGQDHIDVVERIARLETVQEAARDALVKADAADKVQFQHLNDVRREQAEARAEFVSKEVLAKELEIVKQFVHKQIAIWTMIAGVGIAAMFLILKLAGK